MAKILIGDFLIWEKQDAGDAKYSYLDENVRRVGNKHIPIFNVLFENTLKYDNYITINEIAAILDDQGYRINPDTVKKAVQRLREDERWNQAIESSHSGFRIRYGLYEDNDAEITTSSISEEIDIDEPLSVPVPVPKGEAPIIDNSPVLIYNGKNETYVENFIRDRRCVRTYFYQSDSRDVFDVFQPLTLVGADSNTYEDVCFKDLYKDSKRYRYIVSAPIGSGKSLLARKLALEAANSFPEFHIIPILYDLSSFTLNDKTLYEILKDEYESYLPGDNQDKDTDFSFYCQCGNVFLLLDGLDALDSKVKSSFVLKLNAFLRSYSNNTIIIFSRPTASFVEFESFSIFGVKDMSDIQISETIDRLLGSSKVDASALKKIVFEKRADSTDKSYLLSNPLYVSIIASTFRNTPPSFNIIFKFSDIMEHFYKYLAFKNQSRIISSICCYSIDPYKLEEELLFFCHYLVQFNCERFDENDVNNYLKLNHIKSYAAGDYLYDLCVRYGLLQFESGKYRFIDKAIVEYFYAKQLIVNEVDLTSFMRFTLNCYTYSVTSILCFLYDIDAESVCMDIFSPMIKSIRGSDTLDDYKKFLLDYYPNLLYYSGAGDYKVNNHSPNDVFRLMIRKLGFEQDISSLGFPPLDSQIKYYVYKIDKEKADILGLQEGYVKSNIEYSYIFENMGIKPIGKIYSIYTEDFISKKSNKSKEIRSALLSQSFPLRKEFEQIANCILAVRIVE